MKRARITKMKLDELAAVDSGAQAAQGTVVLKRKIEPAAGGPQQKPTPMTAVEKRSALTTATLGHTHLVYGIDDSAAGTTSYESTYVEGGSNDFYTGHCHPWVRNADGSISVGEAMGHTHAIGAMSAELAQSDANKSTHRAVPVQGDDMKLVILSEAQHAHYSKLGASEQEAFVNKSAAERDAEVQKALDADPVVFKGELTGIEVRKSHGDVALRLAKEHEATKKQLRDQGAELEVAKAAREAEVLKARAKTELPNLAATDDVKVAVLKAIDSIADEKLREGAQQMLKGANGVVKTSAPGHSGEGTGGPTEVTKQTAYAALQKGLIEFCVEKKIEKPWTVGLAEFVKTSLGKQLSDAYEAVK